MSWFANNHEGGHCDPFCPFVRDCPSCAFRGGTVEPQQDSARETGQEMGASGMIKERPPVDPASTGSSGPGASPNRKPLKPVRLDVPLMVPQNRTPDTCNAPRVGGVA